MKHISFVILITSATTLSLNSCNKDDDLTPAVNDRFINTAAAPYTIDLVASYWNKIVTGVYTCSFLNIIPPGYSNNREVKVYLLKAEQQLQINNPIRFMDGELSATTTPTDVTINFRHYGELPFNYLAIKIVIE
ncbi:hypothetical protein [Terrimonas pollutisoli]|uniref:hypothetical protein n=1 Tax=Terrimonas pollutisoli TaxID=3034147 RepID=UPI0023EBFABD|nr:hypothetical protein [Terrimonas sp. H1YJ31]